MNASKTMRRAKASQPLFRLAHPLPDLPLAGAPRPKPCPFCGKDKSIQIEFRPAKDGRERSVVCWCQVCGTESPSAHPHDVGESDYELALKATEYWNTRKGAA